MKVKVIPIVIGALGTGARGLRNKRTNREHPNYSIIKIYRNTEKRPGELWRLTVTQTPVEDYQLMPVWKTLKCVINING